MPKLETQELLNGVIVKNFVFRLVFKMFKMLWVEMSINIQTWSSGGPGPETRIWESLARMVAEIFTVTGIFQKRV